MCIEICEKVQKVTTVEEAIQMICACRPRDGSVDEPVIERGVELIESGAILSVGAFAMFVMHLDPDSRHAPTYHGYAIKHFPEDSHWKSIGELARFGTPLRRLATDDDVRREAQKVRRGETIPSLRYAAGFEFPEEGSHRIAHLLEVMRTRVL